MKSRKVLYIMIALVAILPLLGEIFTRQVGMRDSMGVTVGMTVEEYRGQFVEGELFEFHQYGCFVNNLGYPVIVRHDQSTITDVEIIDVAKIDRSAAGYAKLETGMTLNEVGKLVGVPAASEANNPTVLFYLCEDGHTYMLTYQDMGEELVFEEYEVVVVDET